MLKKFSNAFILLILFQLFIQQELVAQSTAPDFTWAKNFGGTGNDGSYDVAIDNAGNIIATGSFENTISFGTFQLTASQGSIDIFVAKFNSNGDVIWAKSAGGSDYDRGYAVAVDNQNNIVITGTFGGRAFFDSLSVLSNGNSDIFIAKYSPSGSILWVTNFGDQGGYEYGFDITTDHLNNILVTGQSQSFGAIPVPVLILTLKYSSQGIFQWAAVASGPNYNSSGYGIAVNSTNDVFVVGCAADSVTFSQSVTTVADPGGDAFLAKYSSNGVFNWVRQAGFNNNNDQGGAVTVNDNDEIFVVGHFRETASFGGNITLTPVGSTDIFVAKYDQLGNPIWARQDSLPDETLGSGISLDKAGNISVIGSIYTPQTESNSIVVERYSKDGKILWNKPIATSPSYGFPGGIRNDANGDIVMSGSYYSLTLQTQDIIIGKLPAPDLVPGINPLDFGIVEVGGSVTNTLSFSNTKAADLFLQSVTLSGPDAADFSIVTGFPQIISAQQSVNVDLQFSPLSTGLKNAYLIIESDAPTSPDTVFLSGTGSLPFITLSSDSMNFGTVQIPDSTDLNLTITNLSSIDIDISNLQITNSEFKLINQVLPDTIHPDENRILQIRFKPH